MYSMLVVATFLALLATGISVSAMECPSVCQCNDNLETDCSSQSLIEIPSNISVDTTKLKLDYNSLTSLEDGAFSSLSELRILDLRRNAIADLSPGTFRGLVNLEELYLQSNLISVLPANVFSELSSLRILELYSNGLSTIEAGAFNGLPNLVELRLSYNLISFLSANLFSGLSSLNYLGLHHNNIVTIEDNTFIALTNLTDIELSHNRIEELRANTLNGLSSLEEFYLNSNNIRSIENGAFVTLTSLQQLILPGNRLSEIRLDMFTGLDNLQVLDLGSNLFSVTPPFVQPYLPNLIDLRLYFNNITSLPDGLFAGLSKLERIHLNEMQLESLPTDFFDVGQAVSYLDLRNNRFRTLPPFNSPNIPTFFSRDVEILFSGNPITVIGPQAFEGFSGTPLNVLTLDMQGMKLDNIDEDAFDGIEADRFEIRLQDNLLTTLNPKSFEFISNLTSPHHSIQLAGNPLACDCHMQEFREWLDSTNEIVSGETECQTPSTRAGVVLRDIDAVDMTCYAPVFDLIISSTSVYEGASVIFECNVAASPDPSVTWQTPHGRWASSMSEMYERLPNNGLRILSVSEEHVGVYACVAENEVGLTIAIRLLDIIAAPTVVAPEHTTEAPVEVKPKGTSGGGTKAGFFIGGLLVGLLLVAIGVGIYLFVRSRRRKDQRKGTHVVADNGVQEHPL